MRPQPISESKPGESGSVLMSQYRMSRRQAFLGLSTLGVGSLRALRGEDTLTVAVLTESTKGSHLSLYLKGLARCQGVSRVVLSDPSGKTFEEAGRLLKGRLGTTYRDHRLLLQQEQPLLAVVTLEAHNAPPVIEDTLKSNSHVLTEKPSCVRLEDFESLARLADSHGLHLMLSMATRVSLAVRKARSLVQNGFIGKPYSATMDWIADQTRLTRPEYQSSWLSFKNKAGGGKLLFHGIHYLDALQYLIGDRIVRVSAICENVGGQPIEVEDAAVVNFRCQKGLVGTLNTGYYLDRGYQNQIRVWGSKGWFHLDLPSGEPLKWYSTHAESPRGIQSFTYQDDPNLYKVILQESIDAALAVGAAPLTTRDSLQVLKVVFAAYRSAESETTQRVA